MSLSAQGPEAAGSSGARSCPEQIVNLKKLWERVSRIIGRWDQKTSFKEKLGVPVQFSKIKSNQIQASNLHMNMQRRQWGDTSSVCALQQDWNSTRIPTEFLKKKDEKHRGYSFRLVEGTDHSQNRCLCGDWPQVGYLAWEQNGQFGSKTERKKYLIFDAAILLEMNITAESQRSDSWPIEKKQVYEHTNSMQAVPVVKPQLWTQCAW